MVPSNLKERFYFTTLSYVRYHIEMFSFIKSLLRNFREEISSLTTQACNSSQYQVGLFTQSILRPLKYNSRG